MIMHDKTSEVFLDSNFLYRMWHLDWQASFSSLQSDFQDALEHWLAEGVPSQMDQETNAFFQAARWREISEQKQNLLSLPWQLKILFARRQPKVQSNVQVLFNDFGMRFSFS